MNLLVFLLLVPCLTSALRIDSESSACASCRCLGDASSQLRMRTLHCEHQLEVTITTLPAKFRAISFNNVTHLRLGRGALQTEALLLVEIRHVDQLLFEGKSVVLQDSSSRIELNITDSYHVEFEPRAVSAEAGDLFVNVAAVDTLKIAGQAFDVLQRVAVANVRSLQLNPFSFKPNVLWNEMADLEVSIEGVEELPVLPSGVFSSTKTITFKDCKIKEIRGKSFSGNQVDRISFDGCAIDRLHSNAFSELLLLGNLSFHRCHLQAVSERAVRSAVTSLLISETSVASLSEGAFKPSLVVTVNLLRNDFQTLGAENLVFHSWNDVSVVGNVFRFLEEGAFLGFETETGGARRSFRFEDNQIQFANMGSLKHSLPEEVTMIVKNNTFDRECDCEILSWMDLMGQSPSDNLVDFDDGEGHADLIGLLKNTSSCAVPNFQAACFSSSPVAIADYRERLCQPRKEGEEDPSVQSKDMCVSSHLEIWRLFSDHVEISKNKGILLVILLFALFVSLLLSIYTLLRWIIYTLQIRHHQLKNEEEWNFTKVEERRMTPEECVLVSPEDHYERLPFMNEEPELEEEEEKQEENHAKKDVEKAETPLLRDPKKEKLSGEDSQRNSVTLAPPKTEPQMTFYDEMIDLLKEKLEDPDNYGTVADSAVGGAASSSSKRNSKEVAKADKEQQDQLLYQDPLEVNKKSES